MTTKLLLHFNGNSVDSAFPANTIAELGAISYEAGKFGQGFAPKTGDLNTSVIKGPSLGSIGSGDFTIEFFAKLAHTQGAFYIFAHGTDMAFYIGSSNNGNIEPRDLVLKQNNLQSNVFVSNSTNTNGGVPNDNQFHHYAIVRHSGNVKLYVDGVVRGMYDHANGGGDVGTSGVNWSGAFSSGQQIVVGGYVYNGDSYVSSDGGVIDEFRVSDTAIYLTDFVSPTVPFPDPSVEDTAKLILHLDYDLIDRSVFNRNVSGPAVFTSSGWSTSDTPITTNLGTLNFSTISFFAKIASGGTLFSVGGIPFNVSLSQSGELNLSFGTYSSWIIPPGFNFFYNTKNHYLIYKNQLFINGSYITPFATTNVVPSFTSDALVMGASTSPASAYVNELKVYEGFYYCYKNTGTKALLQLDGDFTDSSDENFSFLYSSLSSNSSANFENGEVVFSNSNNYYGSISSSSFKLDGRSDFTFEFKTKFVPVSGRSIYTLFYLGADSNNGIGLSIMYDASSYPNGAYVFQKRVNGVITNTPFGSNGLILNQLQHLVLERSGDTIFMVVDGAIRGSISFPYSTPQQGFQINPDGSYNGTIAEVKLSNYAVYSQPFTSTYLTILNNPFSKITNSYPINSIDYGLLYKDLSNSVSVNFSSYSVGKNMPSYSIVFHSDGSSSGTAPATITATVGDSFVISGPESLAKDNQSFSHWSTSLSNSEVSYQPGYVGIMDFDGALDLYPFWIENPKFTITYLSTGATSGSVPVDTNLYESGVTTFVYSNPGSLLKNGYYFAGWSSLNVGKLIVHAEYADVVNGFFQFIVSAPYRYVSYLTQNDTITIFKRQNSNGSLLEFTGTIQSITTTQDGKYDFRFSSPEFSLDSESEFSLGLKQVLGSNDNISVLTNMTFEPVWSLNPISYTLSYVSISPIGTQLGQPPIAREYNSGDIVNVLGKNNLAVDGYTFAGWSNNLDFSVGTIYQAGNTFSMPQSDIKLFAYWIAGNYFSVNVFSNIQKIKKEFCVYVNFVEPVNSWDGTGAYVQGGERISAPIKLADTLYAFWVRPITEGNVQINILESSVLSLLDNHNNISNTLNIIYEENMVQSQKISLITIGNKQIIELDSNPMLNGYPAAIGSKALAVINGVGKTFTKFNSGDMDWVEDKTSASDPKTKSISPVLINNAEAIIEFAITPYSIADVVTGTATLIISGDYNSGKASAVLEKKFHISNGEIWVVQDGYTSKDDAALAAGLRCAGMDYVNGTFKFAISNTTSLAEISNAIVKIIIDDKIL